MDTMPGLEPVPTHHRVTEGVPAGPPAAAPAPPAPEDLRTTIATAVAQGLADGIRAGGGNRFSNTLSIIALTAVVAMGVYHEAGNKPYQLALEALVDIVTDHADCSEKSFEALADGTDPPECPSRKKAMRVVDRNLR